MATDPTLIPARAGISFKPQHHAQLLADPSVTGWVEVHAENYFGPGGPPHRALEALTRHLPLSIHGVGLSLGGAGPLDRAHLAQLRAVVERYRPGLVSEHLAWCANDGAWLNDLLPLPTTREAFDRVRAHVDELQEALGRRVLVENPARYLAFRDADQLPETAFLAELCERTGCGLLLDVNNVYVSACNLGLDAEAYLEAVPARHVGEIHLAGHAVDRSGPLTLRIDDHGSPVCDAVWSLYEGVIRRMGPRPTLIEWDTRVPPLAELLAQARRADAVLRQCVEVA